jgi:hypothetical protein
MHSTEFKISRFTLDTLDKAIIKFKSARLTIQ